MVIYFFLEQECTSSSREVRMLTIFQYLLLKTINKYSFPPDVEIYKYTIQCM